MINCWPAPCPRIRGASFSSSSATSPILRSEERRVGKECRSLCDWSSDVCSSDLHARLVDVIDDKLLAGTMSAHTRSVILEQLSDITDPEIGRASCRERV